MEENDILNDSTRITNCDEKGLCPDFKPMKTLQRKGAKHCYEVTAGNKAQITVLECGNAAGQMCPPAVLFPGKKVNHKLVNSAPSDKWGVFFSESGWMNGTVFESWFECVYLPYVDTIRGSPDDKVLLLLDGHKSHETINLLEMARAKGVIVFCMPANMTHLLQPLDVAYFKPLQQNWDRIVHRMATAAGGKSSKVLKDNFCRTFEEARNRAIAGASDDSTSSAAEDRAPAKNQAQANLVHPSKEVPFANHSGMDSGTLHLFHKCFVELQCILYAAFV